jgi:pimeloyl-ACP methyl ester carboxylesterase
MLKRTIKAFVVGAVVLGNAYGCASNDNTSGPPNSTSSTTGPPSSTSSTTQSSDSATTLERPLASGTYDVNGHSLPMNCDGTGTPTVILEAGTDAPIDAMAALQERLATHFVTCAYQRALATEARTLGDANADLHDLLAAAHVPGPVVLVGQSIGGDLAQLYARTYPNEVAGVVAMNSGPPCGPWLAALPELGNDNLLAGEKANCADTGGDRDRFDLNASYLAEQASPAPPDIPFELIISTADTDWCPSSANPPDPFATQEQCHAAYAIHEHLARQIVAQWRQGNFSQIDAPHEIYSTQLDAIVELVQNVIARAS